MSYYKAIFHTLEFIHFGAEPDYRTHKVICSPIWDLHIDQRNIKDGAVVLAVFKDGKWECNLGCDKFQNGSGPFFATHISFKLEIVKCKEPEEKFY